MTRIALADDHVLLRQSLASLISSFGNFEIIWHANNGLEVLECLKKATPDILLLDIRMPMMDGFETCARVTSAYPKVKVLVLSMMEDEMAIIRMLKNGARGYILKDIEASELRNALQTLQQSGYFFNELVTGKLVHSVKISDQETLPAPPVLTEKELEFLTYSASDLTYKEIADRMSLSPRTIDGYRDVLFVKLNLKSRVGLALYAVKKGMVKIPL